VCPSHCPRVAASASPPRRLAAPPPRWVRGARARAVHCVAGGTAPASLVAFGRLQYSWSDGQELLIAGGLPFHLPAHKYALFTNPAKTRRIFFNSIIKVMQPFFVIFAHWEKNGFQKDYKPDTYFWRNAPTIRYLEQRILTRNSPKYFEWNLAYEKFERFFPLNNAILSFGKCLNY